MECIPSFPVCLQAVILPLFQLSAVQANEDPGGRHQVFPTMDVSNGMLHVAWYDFRHSVTPANEALDVYYASSSAWPTFSHNVRVTDVSHNGNCLMFGGGTAAFHGDYDELDARFDGANHIVHIAWADNRDVSPCDLDAAPGGSAGSDPSGRRRSLHRKDTIPSYPRADARNDTPVRREPL